MEWIGFISLAILLCYSAYPGKVNRLEAKVSKLEKKQRGESEMSRIIAELVGKRCKLVEEDTIGEAKVCTVLDVDEEWVKYSYGDKKKGPQTKIIRIDHIKSVDLVEE